MIDPLEDENLYNIEWIDIENTEMDYENYLNDIENFFREDFEEEVTPKYNTMKLQSMTAFMDEQSKVYIPNDNEKLANEFYRRFFEITSNYKQFIRLPLTLGMFVPVDEEGNVLEEPVKESYTYQELQSSDMGVDVLNYQEAKERVLFEGFKIEDIGLGSLAIRKNGWIIMKCSKSVGSKWENTNSYPDIESLISFEIELTPSAIKSIGL